MILIDGRRMTLTIYNGGWEDKQGDKLVILTIPFMGGSKEAEGEIQKLERFASETKVLSSPRNNVYTNPPESVAGKRLKYTWRFIGARSNMAKLVKKILCH